VGWNAAKPRVSDRELELARAGRSRAIPHHLAIAVDQSTFEFSSAIARSAGSLPFFRPILALRGPLSETLICHVCHWPISNYRAGKPNQQTDTTLIYFSFALSSSFAILRR